MTQSIKIQFNNEEYFYSDSPVLDFNSQYGDHYKVQGKDVHGEEVIIIWEINHPNFSDLEDESDACDWDNPIHVEEN